ncbi:MAG: inosine/xanthosine triphosphatase [Sulfolobales archaeon]
MIRVAVGSENEVKLRGVSRAFRVLMNEDVEVLGLSISETPPQPVGLREIVYYACYRAESCIERSEADYYVGVEAGFHVVESGGESIIINIHVACVIDRSRERYYGFSQAFEITREIYEESLAHGELDRYLEKVLGYRDIGSSVGLIGVVTRNRLTREDLVYGAVSMAITSMFIKNRFRRL